MATETKATLLSPKDLQHITHEAEMAEMRKALNEKKTREESQDELKEAFMAQDVRSDVAERVMRAVRIAAEQGKREVLAIQFPSTFCNDRGRAINNLEPDWPNSLEGYAKRAHDWFKANLEPLGYRTRAEILSFPGGMPGEVGIYLRW
jgi:hypothetical protein